MAATDTVGTQPNVLNKFVSYNTIFTISALTSEQLNFPDSANSYKNGVLGEIILRSGSGYPDNRIMTAYTSPDNPSGKYEFFIDNVEMESFISFNKGTNGSNATQISFKVTEPYSMGMFLQALQLASAAVADKGMLTNYTETPFLLTLEFIGYDADGNIVPVDDTLTRHIPFTFVNVDMKVDASGTTYDCTAMPYNEEAFKDSVSRIKEDVQISASSEYTVQEILQSGVNSLQKRLTAAKKDSAKQGSDTGKEDYVPDQIVIVFPKQEIQAVTKSIADDGESATANPKQQKRKSLIDSLETKVINEGEGANATTTSLLVQGTDSLNPIGISKMGFDQNTGGESQATPANKVQEDPDKPAKRKSNFYDPKAKIFKFTQGTSVSNIITEVLLMSEYCKKSLEVEPDEKGMRKWFRIETQVYLLPPNEGNAARAKRPKLYVYKVVEYLVHEHRFKAPGAPPQGYDELKKNCIKEYNYIYTGKNVDVLNFDIKLQTAMFTTAYQDMNALAGQVYSQINGAGQDERGQPINAKPAKVTADAGIGTPPIGEMIHRYKNAGDGPNDDYRSLIAKNFQEALLNSPADMLTLDISVLGDPYYLADSGMGNFSDLPQTFNLTADGSMNYQSGEVDILINFRTPVDYSGSTGEIQFSDGFDAAGFSGIYNVISVTHTFDSGKFEQTLSCIRRPIQKPVKELEAQVDVGEPTAEADIADDGGSATANPSQATPTKSVDSKDQGTPGSQVEYDDDRLAP